MTKHQKRKVPSMIRNILNLDTQLTHNLVKWTGKISPLRQLKVHHTALEISCHGIPWITSILAFIWLLNNRYLYQVQVNLLLGILLDVTFVSILKAVFRRRRPAVNNDPLAIGPDKYSFPSGHASRAMLVFYIFKYLWPVSVIYLPPLMAWVFAVSVSRILTKKHHILDVCAGILLGYIEGMILGLIYLDAETCLSLVAWMTDEKIDGASYDV